MLQSIHGFTTLYERKNGVKVQDLQIYEEITPGKHYTKITECR